MKIAILDDWFDTLRSLPCFAKLEGHDVTVFTDHVEDPAILAARLADTEVLVLFRERTAITASLLERLPNLKVISQRSVYPHIDVEACTANSVLLCSNMHNDTPSYAAAELTLALMLASARQIPAQVTSTRAGQWQMGVGKTLRGRTLGLYGYGRIAKAVSGYAEALGMNVQWWSSDEGRARAAADGVCLAESRDAFFATSDFVSIHVRLKPNTKGIITAADFGAMQPYACFINTSRAGLIEPNALETALANGNPCCAAIDVFETEPLNNPSHPLLKNPNVIATPHIGYVTEDEFDLQFSDIFDQVIAYANGNPTHMINPEVYP